MCLPIEVVSPDVVLARGSWIGFEWVITHNRMGYRCGYVRLPKGHVWHGKDSDDIPAEVHGGLTFAEADMPCDKGGADDAWWIGFDCAHSGDAPDPNLPRDCPSLLTVGDRVRSQDFVEQECKSLCEQAAQANGF